MGRTRAKGSILIQILLMSAVPLIIGIVALVAISINVLTAGMREEFLSGLSDMAKAVKEVYESMAPGEWYLVDGQLYKGEINLSEQQTLLDDFVKDCNLELTVFFGDTRYVTTLEDKDGKVIGTKAADEVIETVLHKGEVYESYNTNVVGEEYFAHYIPLKNGSEIVGMLFAGKPRAEMNNFIRSKLVLITVPATVILILAIVVCIFFGTRIAKGIREAEHILEIIAGGDLTQSPPRKMLARGDEVGSIARATEQLRGNLSNIVGGIVQSAEVLTQTGTTLADMAAQTETTANEIVSAVEGISKGAVSQAESVEMTCQQIADMGTEIDNITSSVGRLDTVSTEMEDAGNASGKIISELSTSNDKTIEAVERIGHQVMATNEAAEKIKIAISAITEIAEQTNLLSLNASIEAARAGEQGKGFAVVATEISKLAAESGESAQQINDIVDKLNQESEKSIEVMNYVKEIIGVQVEKLSETTNRFAKVTEGINVSREETADIKQKALACDDAKGVIVDAMSNLSAISEENAASTQETNASMEELNATISLLAVEAGKIGSLASELENRVGQFKI